MSVATDINQAAVFRRILLEITAGFRVQAWRNSEGYDFARDVIVSEPVVDVKFNGVSLVKVADDGECSGTPGSWAQPDNRVFVNAPDGESLYGESCVQIFYRFFVSNRDGVLNGIYYEARLRSAPAISLRIEEKFGSVSQVGGGSATLNNADKRFTPYSYLQWSGGTVVVKLGIDLPGKPAMAYADYATLATWLVDTWNINDAEFILGFKEPKGRIQKDIATDVFDKVDYPNLPDNSAGKVIPIAYGKVQGVAPVPIDIAARRLKVSGHAIKSFDLVKIKDEAGNWNTTVFETTDLANGEFTLGLVWDGKADISVDFTGKVVAGVALENPADVIGDILTTAGESINAGSFATSKARFQVGTSSDGTTKNARALSLYISDSTDLLGVIERINTQCFTYVYSDSLGTYFMGVFEPKPGEGLIQFDDVDISGWQEETELAPAGDYVYSKVAVNYAPRPIEENVQTLTLERTANQIEHGFNGPNLRTQDLDFVEVADARYWAERTLITDGRVHKRFRFTIFWRGSLVKPGDLVSVKYDRQSVLGTFEVYDTKVDLTAGKVTLVCGDFRGFRDQVGFWVDDAATLPVRFASLAGYGAGSLVWNSGWAPEIKQWARANVGFWLDENGFADPDDPDSFIASVWF
jgi:hypothetical protein